MGLNPEICYNVPVIFNEREYYMDKIKSLGQNIWNFYESATKNKTPEYLDYLRYTFSTLELDNTSLSKLSSESIKQTELLLTNLIIQLSQVLSRTRVKAIEIKELQGVLHTSIEHGYLKIRLQARGTMFLNGHVTEIVNTSIDNVEAVLAKAISISQPEFYKEITNFLKHASTGTSPLLRGNIAYNLIAYVKDNLSVFEKFEPSNKVSKEAMSVVIEKIKKDDLTVSNQEELLAVANFYFTSYVALINFPIIFNENIHELISSILLIQHQDFFIQNITIQDSEIIELHCKAGVKFFNKEGQFIQDFDSLKNRPLS